MKLIKLTEAYLENEVDENDCYTGESFFREGDVIYINPEYIKCITLEACSSVKKYVRINFNDGTGYNVIEDLNVVLDLIN